MARVAPQHDDAIGQHQGLFNVMRHQEDGLGGNRLLVPQLQQFAAQVLRGQHVEGGERLVHKEYFRLHHQGAGESHPLPHSPGELLWVGCLEAVEANGVEDLQALLAAVFAGNAARNERRLDVLQHGQPGKQGEALKDDAHVDLGLQNGLAMPENLPGGGPGETGEHAQQRRLTRARRAQQGDDLSLAQSPGQWARSPGYGSRWAGRSTSLPAGRE